MKKLFLLLTCCIATTMFAQTRTELQNENQINEHSVDTTTPVDVVLQKYDESSVDVLSQDDFNNKITIYCYRPSFTKDGVLRIYKKNNGIYSTLIAERTMTSQRQSFEFETTYWDKGDHCAILTSTYDSSVKKDTKAETRTTYFTLNQSGPGAAVKASTSMYKGWESLNINFKFTNNGPKRGSIKVYKQSDWVTKYTSSPVVSESTIDDRNNGNISFSSKYMYEDTYVIVMFENNNIVATTSIKCGQKTLPSISASCYTNMSQLHVNYKTSSIYNDAQIKLTVINRDDSRLNDQYIDGVTYGIIKNIDTDNGNSGTLYFTYTHFIEGDYKVELIENNKVTASTTVHIAPLGLMSMKVSSNTATINYTLGNTATSAYVKILDAKGIYNRQVPLNLNRYSCTITLPTTTFGFKGILYVNGIPVSNIKTDILSPNM